MNRILVIEDDVILGDMLCMYLTEEGYEVKQALSGEQGMAMLAAFEPNLLLLDLMLPDTDGIALCERIRRDSNVPIMIVSLKTDVSERVHALKAGADDYLCKPFSMQELRARIETILRRVQPRAAGGTAPVKPEAAGRVSVDVQKRTIVLDGEHLETTYSGFEIMRMFVQHPGRVFSREELINALRGVDSFVNDRAIDVHVTNLRKRIERNPKEPQHIRTVWGVGYKFMP